MHCERDIPDNFDTVFSVNLQKNRKPQKAVNLIALIIAVVMIVPMVFFFPLSVFLDANEQIIIMVAVFCVGEIGYLVCHELIHVIFMRAYGSKTARLSFNGILVYTKCYEYFYKKQYFIITLAPIVILGLILLVVNVLIPASWFWVVYVIQISNIAGASGDFYVIFKLRKLSQETLVLDSGLDIRAFSKKE